MRRIFSVLVLGLAFLTSGCINISTRIQPEDTSVKSVLVGSDCVPIILGLGAGTVTLENAKADGHSTAGVVSDPSVRRSSKPSTQTLHTAITRVRYIETQEMQILFFGSRCIEVTGE